MRNPYKGRGHFEYSADRAIACALEPDVRSATVFHSATARVTATRRFRSLRGRSIDLVVTIGAPNYAQRRFAQQHFPQTRVHLRFWPKRKRAARK